MACLYLYFSYWFQSKVTHAAGICIRNHLLGTFTICAKVVFRSDGQTADTTDLYYDPQRSTASWDKNALHQNPLHLMPFHADS